MRNYLLYIIFLLLISCHCINHYGREENEIALKNDFFEISCFTEKSDPDGMKLIVNTIIFKDSDKSISCDNLKIIPILENDTLKLKEKLFADNIYHINNKNSLENLKLIIEYDSITKSNKKHINEVYNLKRFNKCYPSFLKLY